VVEMAERLDKLYVVDDSEDIREAIRANIESAPGMEDVPITEFTHGDNLCGLITATKPEERPVLVLMDTQMSVIDGAGRLVEDHMPGYAVCRNIKGMCPEVQVIGMSANPDYKSDWIKAGADAFVYKIDLPKFMSKELPGYILKR